MAERRGILDTPPRGSKDVLAPPDKVRNCWIYGTGPYKLSCIQEVASERKPNHDYDWEGYIPNGRIFVIAENVKFVHTCAEQRRKNKKTLKGTSKVQTYYGIAYKPKRDEVFE